MSSTKPAIVIVPGAFYKAWHYSFLHDALVTAGYEVATCDLPSTGGETATSGNGRDVEVVRSAIKAYIARDLNVVVAMHSFGGLTGSSACKGLRPQDQANGKGVVSLVYLCAGVPIEGVSMLGGTGGAHPPWARLMGEPNTGIFMFCDNPPFQPKELFYNDCTPEIAAEATQKLEYWSEGCMWSPCLYTAWMEIESNYLVCELDQALPPQLQEFMVTMEEGKGLWRRVERVRAGHSPFLSTVEETAGFIRRCAGEERM